MPLRKVSCRQPSSSVQRTSACSATQTKRKPSRSSSNRRLQSPTSDVSFAELMRICKDLTETNRQCTIEMESVLETIESNRTQEVNLREEVLCRATQEARSQAVGHGKRKDRITLRNLRSLPYANFSRPTPLLHGTLHDSRTNLRREISELSNLPELESSSFAFESTSTRPPLYTLSTQQFQKIQNRVHQWQNHVLEYSSTSP